MAESIRIRKDKNDNGAGRSSYCVTENDATEASVFVLINNQPDGDWPFIQGRRLAASVVFALHGRAG
jgi:hypothetical protein